MSTTSPTPTLTPAHDITATGVASVGEHGRAHLLNIGRRHGVRPSIRIVLIVWVCIMVIGMAAVAGAAMFHWLRLGTQPGGWEVFAIVGVAFFLYFLIVRGFYYGMRARRIALSEDGIHWQISEERLANTSPIGESNIPWTAFNRLHLSSNLAMLYLRSTGQYFLFTRRMFDSDAHWQAFRRLAARQLGECRRCHYPLRGTAADTCPECGEPLPGVT